MFQKRTSQTKSPSEFPQGTFIKTEKGYFYVQSPVKRLRFSTERVLDSWSPQRIIQASESDAAVKKMRVTSKMKFRNGSLLYYQVNGSMYLVSDNKLRQIDNPDWLDFLGVGRNDGVWVSTSEINLHEIGEPLI